MSKHTPGPWGLRYSRDGSGDVGVTANGVANVIAECFAAMRSRNENAREEAEANARLIAAAPEMLKVLRNIRDSYRGYIPDFIEVVNAVIDKAEGTSAVPSEEGNRG